MATTTNYDWETPDDTDLVKDGAAAIRTLGSAIDTTMATMVPKSLVDAKGDLFTATADNTPARLAVGTNGYTLVADSAEATGLKWVAPAGGGKVLQVVSASTATQTTSSSSTYADTTLTGTITPTLATSNILVMMSQNGVAKFSSDTRCLIKLFRGATEIAYVSHAAGETSSAAMNNIGTVSINYLDSPATTSATTYKTQFMSAANASGVKVQDGGSLSTIILLEIGV
jgi:hypothetical protein